MIDLRAIRMAGLALLTSGCLYTSVKHPRTGVDLKPLAARSAQRMVTVMVEDFSIYDYGPQGGFQVSLVEPLQAELERRGLVIVDSGEDAVAISGWISPYLLVQPPRGMQVIFHQVAVREVAIVVRLKTGDREQARRVPVRIEDTSGVMAHRGRYSRYTELAVRLAAGAIIEELEGKP